MTSWRGRGRQGIRGWRMVVCLCVCICVSVLRRGQLSPATTCRCLSSAECERSPLSQPRWVPAFDSDTSPSCSSSPCSPAGGEEAVGEASSGNGGMMGVGEEKKETHCTPKCLWRRLCEGWMGKGWGRSGLYNRGTLCKLFKVSDSNWAKDDSNYWRCSSDSSKTEGHAQNNTFLACFLCKNYF